MLKVFTGIEVPGVAEAFRGLFTGASPRVEKSIFQLRLWRIEPKNQCCFFVLIHF